MEYLPDLLTRLPERHCTALHWFMDSAGSDQLWPKPLPDGTLLATRAKGIYKPSWSTYALSIRQTLGGPYPDREPVLRPDGTWVYAYFQESHDPNVRDRNYTNRGLVDCWRDRVPVGVMRQTSATPQVRYRVLGLALIAGWDGGYFFLEGFSLRGLAHGQGPGAEVEMLSSMSEHTEVEAGTFDPASGIDSRERTLASITRRRGQPEFRQALLELYEGRCAITGCDVVAALEAAHITPYRGPQTNHPSNGLLLRADLHTLFDLGLVSINPSTLCVVLSPHLASSLYAELAGKPLRLPRDASGHPSFEALHQHYSWSGL